MLEYRLWGSVSAQAPAGPVDLGSPQQRLVLTVLLLSPAEAVPVDALINAVWGDAAPRRARAIVYSYVSRLRSVLAVADPLVVPVLRRTSAGYLLACPVEAVDVHRAALLAMTARRSAESGADEQADVQFAGALALSAGTPLAGLDGDWVTSTRERLSRDRFAVAVEHAEVRLRLGRHRELIPELTRLAEANPIHEDVVGHLMLALYRSGRMAESLDRYARLRRLLRDELGAEPGPLLRALHERMLRDDPSLAPAAGLDGPAVRPAQLPLDVRGFCGRRADLDRLDRMASPPDPSTAAVVCTVSGTAGVGKSALAVHWAHRARDRFPDGQLYVNLRGFDPGGTGMSHAEAVRGFVEALGVSPQRIPTGLSAQVGLYRSLLADKRVLILLDNARDADQVRPLLPGSPGCLVVVTSRNQMPGLTAAYGAQPLTLDLLSIDEAGDLLAQRIGADRVAAERGPVEDIIARCARLPLALSLVAAQATHRRAVPLATLAEELADPRHALDTLTGGDASTEIRSVFSWSYQTLSGPGGRLFRLLGAHPGPDIDEGAAASLAGLPPDRLRPVLAELTRTNLLSERHPGRYEHHDLLRAYAAELATTHDGGDESRSAMHRLFDHYLHTALAADSALNPHRPPIGPDPPAPGVVRAEVADVPGALRWLTAEHRVLLRAIDRAGDAGFDTHAWKLARAMSTFLNRQGYWGDLARTQRAALAATRRTGDLPGQGHAHRALARAYTYLGDYRRAHVHYRHALDLATRRGDRADQAHTHLSMANTVERQHRNQEALKHARQALALFRAAGDPVWEANALNAVGWYHSLLGEHRLALTHCRQSRVMLRDLGDPLGEAAAWDSIGHAHHHMRHYRSAVTSYHRAVRLFREAGAPYEEATTLVVLGDAHQEAGQPDLAYRAWMRALDISGRLAHHDAKHVRARIDRLEAERRPGDAGVGAPMPEATPERSA